MRYQWLLFDADNTLFDFNQAKNIALTAALARWDISATPHHFQCFELINSRIWQAFERGEITAAALRVQRFVEFMQDIGLSGDARPFSELFLATLGQQAILLDGAEQVIARLQPHYRLMLITNGLQDVQRSRWAACSLRPYFADIVISDEVGVAKPDPRIYDIAFARMGMPERSQVLMIGDSLSSDMQGGITYGLDTCWLNLHGTPRPDHLPIRYEIRHLRQLVPLLLEQAEEK